jgi:hypothetical protein
MTYRKKSRLWLVLMFVLGAFGAAGAAAAQTVTTGGITGTVKDSQGGVLPGATVTATSADTGARRETVTDEQGGYRFTLLGPGRYTVEAELAGIGKASVPNVEVLLGNDTRADISLTPTISESIEVVATTPVVDTRRSGVAASVTTDQIQNLPILGRDFKSLASLTPGIVEAFGGRITSDGARGVSTDYNIDGASSNNDFFGENTGGTRAPFTFSQAAIREFQVVRSQYDAEYGRGVGAQLNAITKSGTNDLHGEAFVYHRNDSWASTRPNKLSNGQTVVDSFRARTSTQPGFAIGGPIVQNKAFFFGNFDAQRQKLPITVTDVNQRAEFRALSPSVQQQFLAKVQSILGHPYAEELNYDQTFNQNTYLGKVDLNAWGRTLVSIRDNYTNFENGHNQSLNNLSNQGVEHDKFNQLVGQATTALTSRLTNQLLVEYSKDQRPVDPISTSPEVQISGIITGGSVFFGQNDFLPNNTVEDKVQVKDAVHFTMGVHSFKAGTDLLFMNIDNLFPRNANGVFLYNTPQAFVDGTPNSFRQGYGPGGGLTSWNQNTYAFFVADSLRVNPQLTIDLGVRYDWQTMPKPQANAFPQHPEFISQFSEDKNNVAPRVGVAYDLFGRGTAVLRGGIGKFFGYMPDILLSNPLTQISGNFNQVTITCATATTVRCPPYPSILTPDQFAQLARVATDIVTVASDYQAQEAWRGSIQYEQQIGRGYSASVGTVLSKLTHVQGSRNINSVPSGIVLGNVPVYNLLSPQRKYPDLGVVRELCSCEEASFRSLTLETHRLAVGGSRLSWDLNYTWSRSIDQDTNERSTSSSFLFDPFNPSLSEGPSDNDVRHKIAGSAVYRLPYGFTISGIASWRSGLPYTGGIAFTGVGIPGAPNSLNGQSQMTGNIPVFVDSSGQIIDLLQATNSSRAQLADFLASRGARIIGRNTFRQPDSHVVDMRVTKSFALPRGVQAEVLAEVFNLFNTRIEAVAATNLNLVRATYAQATDRYTFTSFASTFGKTSSYVSPDPRQLQMAVRFRF